MPLTQDTAQIPALPAFEPDHPGLILREEFLEPCRAEVKETAEQLGVTRQTLHRILAGGSSITAEMALRLERLTGASATLWLNLQAQHDLWHQSRALAADLKVIRRISSSRGTRSVAVAPSRASTASRHRVMAAKRSPKAAAKKSRGTKK